MFTLTRDPRFASDISDDEIVDDDAGEELVEPLEEYASLDLKTFPSGLRSLSRFNNLFDTENEFDGQVDDVFSHLLAFLPSSIASSSIPPTRWAM